MFGQKKEEEKIEEIKEKEENKTEYIFDESGFTQLTLPSGRSSQLRKMMLMDEDTLLDKELARKNENLDQLLKNTTGESAGKLENTLVGDRTYLHVELRIISRGKIFEPIATCPKCDIDFETSIDLKKLPITMLDKNKVDENFHFYITLPESGHELKARLLTGVEEKELIKIKRDFPKKLSSYLMMLRTVSVKGKDMKPPVDWFRKLPIADIDHFKQEHEDHDCGVETTVEVMHKCGKKFNINIPFDEVFFLQGKRTPKQSGKE